MMKWTHGIPALVMALCASCSNEQQGQALAAVPVDTLRIADSIGVMYGDSNYVFGEISDVERGPQGEIYVLDRRRNCILAYSPDGAFMDQIGRYGEGPGEFNDPSAFVITGDGSVLVANGRLWSRFDEEWEFIDSQPLGRYSIMEMTSCGEDSITGILNYLDFVDEGMSIGRRIALWSEYNPDSLLAVFYQADHIANVPNDIVTIDLYHYVRFTVIDDIVYVAPDPLAEPLVVCYETDGTPRDTLLLPYVPVPKTDDDIAREKSFIEGNLAYNSNGRMSIDWEPYPYRAMISELGTDSQGRLWVQRGFEDFATFDIIDTGNLEIVETAVIPEIRDLLYWKFHVSEFGVLGICKYDFPVIYIVR